MIQVKVPAWTPAKLAGLARCALVVALPCSGQTVLHYGFPVGKHLEYEVKVGFDGYLPVGRGGNATADLDMKVDVAGAAAAPDGNPRISSEIRAFKLTFNGAVMPFGPANIKAYFPKTTIEATPAGHQVATDAPNIRMFVHLPGLDVKRFPDITYLPLEFPMEPIHQGASFRFVKPFGDGPVEYEVTPTNVGANTVDLAIKFHQTSVVFEDARRAPTDEAHATRRIDSKVDGSGTATFDLGRGLVMALDVEAQSVGLAKDLTTQATVERKLKTTLSVRLTPEP